MKRPRPTTVLRTGALVAVILFSGWIRLQGAATLPPGQFTETDAYLYYQQARLIAENGHLPERDMHRWVPLGRDLGQTLNLYPAVLAFVSGVLRWLGTGVTLYQVTAFAPAVWFCLALAALSLFLAKERGWGIALPTALILATLPATIERSAAGFGDRDSWCLLLGILCVITTLLSRSATAPRPRLLWTGASGLCLLLLGLSWEGGGIFLLLILGTELWLFLTTDTDEGVGYDWLWVCLFVPPLYLASPAYRSGEGFATHLFALMLAPPLFYSVLRTGRRLLLTKTPWAAVLQPHARRLARGLTAVLLLFSGSYFCAQLRTFDATSVPFNQSALMQTIGELQAPHFGYWLWRYGSIFIAGSVGMALLVRVQWGKSARVLFWCLLACATLAFFRQPLDAVWGNPAFGDALFVIATIACVGAFFQLAFALPTQAGSNRTKAIPLVMILWTLVFLVLSRDAKRYDFFLGIPLAYFTAELLAWGSTHLASLVHNPNYTTALLRQKLPQGTLKNAFVALGLLAACLLGPQNGGYLYRTYFAATQLRTATPGAQTPLATCFDWMTQHLPSDAVVAAEWSFGTQLNVLAGVRTITDPDHYLPHWIHLYDTHVRFTKNEAEALAFLFSHGATHLLTTPKHPPHGNILGEQTLSEAFVPVYPTQDFITAPVKLWALRYPPNIQADPKYIQTHPDTLGPEPHEIGVPHPHE